MKEWIKYATDTDQSRMFLLQAWKQTSVASDPAALYNFTYDALGRTTQILASVTGLSDSVLLGQQFDASGNRTQLNVDIGLAVDSTVPGRIMSAWISRSCEGMAAKLTVYKIMRASKLILPESAGFCDYGVAGYSHAG